MTRRDAGSRRRPVVVVVVVAVALTMCVQTLQGLLQPAPAGSSGVGVIEPRPVGGFKAPASPPQRGSAGPDFFRAYTATPTGVGDASQVWFADGRWWGVLVGSDSNEFHIWAYDKNGQTWVDTGTRVDDRPFVRPDVLWDGESLYVIAGGRRAYRSEGIRLTRFSYDEAARRWSADPDFPVAVTDAGAGDPLIAKGPDGTLWVATVHKGRVMVAHSEGNDAVWTAPAPLHGQGDRQSVSAMSMTAHADGVSVVWVPQHSDELVVTTHRGGPTGGTWDSTARSIYGLGGIDAGARLEDLTPTDLSVRAYGTGPARRLYVAFKTSLSKQGSNEQDPQILLATIDRDGGTTTTMVSQVADNHSHPVVAIDRDREQVLVIATTPNLFGGVHVKRASLSNPVFAEGIGDAVINRDGLFAVDHAGTSKHDLDSASGLLVLASDDVEGHYSTGFERLSDGLVAADVPPPLPADPPAQTILIHDTFDQQPLDGPPPASWFPKSGAPPPDGGAKVTSVLDSRGRSMQLTSDENGTALEYCRALPPVADAPVTVVADVKVSAIGTADAHLLTVTGGGPIASIRATSKGEIGFVTPDGRLQLGTLPIGVFVRVSVTVEPATKTYFLTVSPRDGGPALLALERQPWAGARLQFADEVCVQSGSGVAGLALVIDELLVTTG